jgi:ATP-dependent helicase HrpA
MQMRLAKYPANVERDGKHAASIAQLWGRFEMRLDQQKKAGLVDPHLLEFRWQIEELRVSLYAQELKTPYPVSYKRLDKLWTAMG